MAPFSQDPPGGYSPSQPLFPSLSSPSSSFYPPLSRHISRPQRGQSRSHPQTPLPNFHPPTSPTLPAIPVLPGQPPIDPARKITPPEEDIHARDEEPAVANECKSLYDEALAYIREYKAWRNLGFGPPGLRRPLEDYEKPLAIKMSLRDWVKLRGDLDRDLDFKDDSYPRFSFDASTSMLIIQCMPSAIHQSITSILNTAINHSTANLPATLLRQTRVLFEQDFVSFRGRWAGSDKRPDLGIQVRNAENDMELKWVLEVGFSEKYEQLKSDVRLWLEGSSQVSMVTIAKFCETPPYHCPLPIYNDDGEELDPREAVGIPSDFTAIRGKDVLFEGQYGPAMYKGLRWVERIAEVWIEIWVRDADGKATQHGDPINIMQADQVQLEFGHFLPPGYPHTITIDLQEFRLSLQDRIREMAVFRCGMAVKNYLKRHAEGRDDGDYHP